MSPVLAIIGLSIIVQAVAAAAALRLHWIYGHRWAWSFVSAAILLITVRRCITFYRIMTGDLIDSHDVDEPSPLLASASIALLVSILFLVGIGLLEPVFRDMGRAEAILLGEKESLQDVLRLNEAEFRVAHKIQQALFPGEAPEFAGLDIAGASHPALSAGGDLYDYLSLPDGGMGIVVADVSGHGVGPAMIMAETRAYLRAITRTEDDCGKVLALLNQYLCEDDLDAAFVTCFFAKLDPGGRVLTFASAGQPAYLVDADMHPTKLESQGAPLGVVEGGTYETSAAVSVTADSLLVVPTDGILEAQSGEGELFGPKRMLTVLSDQRLHSARDLISGLHHAVGEFTDWAPQKDDMTAVIVRAC